MVEITLTKKTQPFHDVSRVPSGLVYRTVIFNKLASKCPARQNIS